MLVKLWTKWTLLKEGNSPLKKLGDRFGAYLKSKHLGSGGGKSSSSREPQLLDEFKASIGYRRLYHKGQDRASFVRHIYSMCFFSFYDHLCWCVWLFGLHVCLRTICEPSAYGGQKRGLDPLGLELSDGCVLPCGCWEPNPGLPQEQPVLLTIEPRPLLLKNKYFKKDFAINPL